MSTSCGGSALTKLDGHIPKALKLDFVEWGRQQRSRRQRWERTDSASPPMILQNTWLPDRWLPWF